MHCATKASASCCRPTCWITCSAFVTAWLCSIRGVSFCAARSVSWRTGCWAATDTYGCRPRAEMSRMCWARSGAFSRSSGQSRAIGCWRIAMCELTSHRLWCRRGPVCWHWMKARLAWTSSTTNISSNCGRCEMRREGSPWQGLWAVTAKELADHLRSSRMRLLEWLIVLTAAASLYGVFQAIRRLGAADAFLFLRLFTLGQAPMPSFAALLGFLIPLVAIGLGFDAINGE